MVIKSASDKRAKSLKVTRCHFETFGLKSTSYRVGVEINRVIVTLYLKASGEFLQHTIYSIRWSIMKGCQAYINEVKA